MKPIRINHTYRHADETVRLYHLTDMHLGARATDEKLLESDISFIANDPNAVVFLGGDQVDAIIPPDKKRFTAATVAPWALGSTDIVARQVQRAVDMLEPIKDKIAVIARGNHEGAVAKYHDRNVHAEFLGVMGRMMDKRPQDLDLTNRGFVTLAFKRGKTEEKAGGTAFFVVYMTHGVGGGILPGGDALTLGRLMDNYQADIYLMGHRHKQHAVSKTYTGVNRAGTGITVQTRVAVMTPSYLNTWIVPGKGDDHYDTPATYSDESEFNAIPLGVRPIVLRPYTGAIDVIQSNRDGLENMAAKLF